MKTLTTLLAHHPYAICGLLLASFSAIALIGASREHRRSLLLSGVLSAPWALSSVLFVPDYWNPERLWGGPVGVEDLVFSYSTGVLAWALPYWRLPAPIPSLQLSAQGVGRLLLCWLAGSLACTTLLSAGARAMPATLASMLILGTALARMRRDLIGPTLRGALGFAGLYFLVLKSLFMAYPVMPGYWNGAGLLGFWLTGVPVDELLWAASFGAVWPLMMTYCLAPPARAASRHVSRSIAVSAD